MSGKQPESYEAPTVEEIDADVKPIATAAGVPVSVTQVAWNRTRGSS
jgi:hypothetical protein